MVLPAGHPRGLVPFVKLMGTVATHCMLMLTIKAIARHTVSNVRWTTNTARGTMTTRHTVLKSSTFFN